METFFAIAWLVSTPLLIAMGAFRSRYSARMWHPEGFIQRCLVWLALIAGPIAATAHLLGFENRMAGMPMLGNVNSPPRYRGRSSLLVERDCTTLVAYAQVMPVKQHGS